MRFLDLTLPTPAENLALDEAFLVEAETGRGGEILRLWEWLHTAVVLGAGCRLADDVFEANCLADGVPVLRRASGGGTVLLGAGCLLFSLVLAYHRAVALREITSSYAYILDRISLALNDRRAGLERIGTSDLAAAGRKFSGNAQQRKRNHLLHHGTLLYRFDLESVGRYLALPRRQPEYRHQRGHRDFLQNLEMDREDLERRLRAAWQAEAEGDAWPEGLVRQLVLEKYTRPEWIRRR
jgi:lipoate-protein ligase A